MTSVAVTSPASLLEAAESQPRTTAQQRQDLALLRALRRHTINDIAHHVGRGVTTPTLTAATDEPKPTHLYSSPGFTDPDIRRRVGAVAVEVRGSVLIVQQWLPTPGGTLGKKRTHTDVSSVDEAVEILVALQLLHPRWSRISQVLSSAAGDLDTCPACALLDDICPHHEGRIEGGTDLAQALQVLADQPNLMTADLAAAATVLWHHDRGTGHDAAPRADTPDNDRASTSWHHDPQTRSTYLARALAEDPGLITNEIRAAGRAARSAAARPPDRSGLTDIGYQGHTVDSLVANLQAARVTRVVDVRLNAVSRKRGLSKKALSAALHAAGIAYEHRPELGNPRPNRAGFAGPPDERAEAARVYQAVLTAPAGRAALDHVAHAAAEETVALLCIERDTGSCHRAEILQALRLQREALAPARPA